MRVLLVEDDALLGNGLHQGLIQHGFAVDWLRDGDQAEAALMTQDYDCVVLDWQLPGLSGLEVLKRLRARRKRVPVLMLTARDALEDRISGLDGGADDYLVKPVALSELAARLRAQIRRAAGQPEPVFRWGSLTLDPALREVRLGDELVLLSNREFDVLAKLISQPSRPLSQDQLAAAMYAWGDDIQSNAVEVHVHHLRKKLGADWIRTIRGVGYVLDPAKGKTT